MKIGNVELEKGVETVLRGTIIYLHANVGSKSEGVYPCLYLDRNTMIKIFKEGDDPIGNHGFDEFDGKLVDLKGSLGRSNFFIVKEITKI